MRKVLCAVPLTICMVCLSLSAESQVISQPKLLPPAPSVRELEKFTNYEVGLPNGVASFNIPLYTVNIGNISFPITLSYHSTGIKYNQRSNDLGVGWIITPVYQVSRTVYGRPDERYDMGDVSNSYLSSFGNNNADRDKYLSSFISSGAGTDSDIPPPELGYKDGAYDIFNYNIGSDAGSFVIKDRTLKKIRLVTSNPTSVEYEQNSNVGEPTGIKYLKIKDGNGITYEMGKQTGTSEKFYGVSSGSSNESAITAWYASRIYDAYNSAIKIDYVDGTEGENTSYEKNVLTRDLISSGSFYDPGGSNNSVGQGRNYQIKLMNSIQTINDRVQFYRTSSSGRIDSISVYQGSKIVKKILFSYITAGQHTLLQQILIKGEGSVQPQKYSFSYYKTDIPINNLGRDYWGYYSDNGFTANSFPRFENLNVLTATCTPLTNVITLQNMNASSAAADYYSLKRIDLPTGGYREFEYEAHQYSGFHEENNSFGTKYMGMRIKRIKSGESASSAGILIEDYKYGLNEGGIGYVYEDMARNYLFAKEGVRIYDDGSNRYTARYRNYSSINPYIGYYDMAGGIYYPQVTVYRREAEISIGSNGKTEYFYETDRMFPQLSRIYLNNSYSIDANVACTNNNPSTRNYYNYYMSLISLWDKPVVKTVKRYDGTRLIGSEEYQYTQQNAENFNNLHIEKFAAAVSSFSAAIRDRYYLSGIESFFDYANYTISCVNKVLSNKVETSLDAQNNTVTATTSYTYNDFDQVSTQTVDTERGEKYTTVTKYPLDYSLTGTLTDATARGIKILRDFNLVNTPVEQYAQVSGAAGTNIRTVSAVFNEYDINRPLLNRIYRLETATPVTSFAPAVILGSGTTKDSRYSPFRSYNQYDSYGNIMEFKELENPPQVYIWGYNGQYPVMEIKNVTYSEVVAVLTQAAIDNLNSSSQTEATMEVLIKNAGDKLRGDSRMSKAMINCYTYKPLVGMTSKTDPRGIIEFYKYDGMQRLQSVLDNMGNVTKNVDYHYRSN